MIKCNNPKCGYELNWKDRYKICPKCGFIMKPYKEKKTIFTGKKEPVIELEELDGD